MVWQWTDVSGGRGKVNLLFRAFAGIWYESPDDEQIRATNALLAYRVYIDLAHRIYVCLHVHTKLGIYMHIPDSTQRTIAYTGTYTTKGKPRKPWGPVGGENSTLPSLTYASLTLSPSFNVLHIRPLSPMPFESPYSPPLLFSHYIHASPQPA